MRRPTCVGGAACANEPTLCEHHAPIRCRRSHAEDGSAVLIAWLRSPAAQLVVHAALVSNAERIHRRGGTAAIACEALARVLESKTVVTSRVVPP